MIYLGQVKNVCSNTYNVMNRMHVLAYNLSLYRHKSEYKLNTN